MLSFPADCVETNFLCKVTYLLTTLQKLVFLESSQSFNPFAIVCDFFCEKILLGTQWELQYKIWCLYFVNLMFIIVMQGVDAKSD